MLTNIHNIFFQTKKKSHKTEFSKSLEYFLSFLLCFCIYFTTTYIRVLLGTRAHTLANIVSNKVKSRLYILVPHTCTDIEYHARDLAYAVTSCLQRQMGDAETVRSVWPNISRLGVSSTVSVVFKKFRYATAWRHRVVSVSLNGFMWFCIRVICVLDGICCFCFLFLVLMLANVASGEERWCCCCCWHCFFYLFTSGCSCMYVCENESRCMFFFVWLRVAQIDLVFAFYVSLLVFCVCNVLNRLKVFPYFFCLAKKIANIWRVAESELKWVRRKKDKERNKKKQNLINEEKYFLLIFCINH